ncbi:PREDICTED: uncharacterized protein LOC109591287, partial [Amphimedon queenslandica]|uniref:Immunoglobulin subtype domain-containing protein n=1 Tax=Amphimedon queenslandica TaxID=400682 RepID=A0AAN0K0B5_AMPQE
MTESALLLGSCLLLLVVQSLSLCVLEDGKNSTCSSSSLLLVSRSQIKDNNGYSLIVNKLPYIATNCTSTNSEKEFNAFMGERGLETEFLDKDNTTVKINILGDVGSGQHIISISRLINDSNCCKVEAVLNHEITVKVIDDPYAHHQNTDPQTIQCTVLHSDFSDMWTEFMLNDAVLGYCGHFTSPVEHKNGISIYYDTTEGVCTLKIDKLTDDNKGNYSCSVMVPYPDGNGFLRLNSSSIPINCPKNYDKTILAATR